MVCAKTIMNQYTLSVLGYKTRLEYANTVSLVLTDQNPLTYFPDCILTDALAHGISDHEIQLDLLGDAKQDMTLEQMLKFIESKESGKHFAS